MNIVGGFVFDIFGRKYPLSIFTFLCGAIIAYMPFSSPNQLNYIIASVSLNLVMTPIAYSPVV